MSPEQFAAELIRVIHNLQDQVDHLTARLDRGDVDDMEQRLVHTPNMIDDHVIRTDGPAPVPLPPASMPTTVLTGESRPTGGPNPPERGPT